MTDLSPAPLLVPALSRPRVALLIDGDNRSPTHAGKVLSLAAKEGEVTIRRVYGGPSAILSWEKTTGFRRIDAGAGKNAADLLLCIEAMDLMLGGRADVLVIASSDRDFSHLATHLRESGRRVVGIGEAKAPAHFLHCCSAHHVLKDAGDAPTPTPAAIPAKAAASPLDQKIIALIKSEGQANRMQIGLLAGRMHALHKVRISTYPQRTWRAYLLSRPDLFECEPKGPAARVRLR